MKVEQNIPIPKMASSRGLFPWHDMQVGDSFFAPGYKTGNPSNGLKSFNASAGDEIIPGSKWRVRSVVEDGVQGLRVWRLK